MQRSELLAIMATLLIREQYVSAQGAQFEGAVDDAEALLKVIESRQAKTPESNFLMNLFLGEEAKRFRK
jgi:hypothetical protein